MIPFTILIPWHPQMHPPIPIAYFQSSSVHAANPRMGNLHEMSKIPELDNRLCLHIVALIPLICSSSPIQPFNKGIATMWIESYFCLSFDLVLQRNLLLQEMGFVFVFILLFKFQNVCHFKVKPYLPPNMMSITIRVANICFWRVFACNPWHSYWH